MRPDRTAKELLGQLRAMCQRNGWIFRNPGGDDPKIERGEDMNDFRAEAEQLDLDPSTAPSKAHWLPGAWVRGAAANLRWCPR
jgi:hypothetical protein